MTQNTSPVRIANMSGFYGDRLKAPLEMLEGGPIDYLTGDYLAELTMAILYKVKSQKPDGGYAATFLKQMEMAMGLCMDKGVKVVVNAGGLNPGGLAKALEGLAETLQIHPKIAYLEGDDLMPQLGALQKEGLVFTHLDRGTPLTESGLIPVSANAYLGCWGIVEALNRGADIVLTGRVADTSLVMGPAAHHFGWEKDNWDALAGAAVAGHIIECGGQASGGNYSYFEEVPSFSKVGFPIAEIMAEGNSVITKHPNTGGLISVGTVTAQLLYEINAPDYKTPDVVAHFGSIQLEQIGEDRVQVRGVKGSPAPQEAKVTLNGMGGYQNSMTFYMAGLDNARKAEILKNTFLESVGGEKAFQDVAMEFWDTAQVNPQSNEQAMAQLKISVNDPDAKKAGKFFTSKLIELALCQVPGFCLAQPPGPAKPRIVHFPTLIPKQHLKPVLHVNGEAVEITEMQFEGESTPYVSPTFSIDLSYQGQDTQPLPLGKAFAARSGDKGGNANLGIWGRDAQAYGFLHDFLTVEKFKELIPDARDCEVIRYEFPNLHGLNFYMIGFLGDGVAASHKMDAQAKTTGEYLRMKVVDLPVGLLRG